MIKERPKIWAIFLAVCIIAHLAVYVAGPAVITFFQKAIINQEADNKQEEIESTEPSEPSEGSDQTEDNESTALLGKTIEMLGTAMRLLGCATMMFGIFRLVLGLAHEDPEGLPSAIPLVAVGSVMIIAPILFEKFLM